MSPHCIDVKNIDAGVVRCYVMCMSEKMTAITILVPADDLREIDRRVEVAREREPGRQCSRADIVRKMIAANLSLSEAVSGVAKNRKAVAR